MVNFADFIGLSFYLMVGYLIYIVLFHICTDYVYSMVADFMGFSFYLMVGYLIYIVLFHILYRLSIFYGC